MQPGDIVLFGRPNGEKTRAVVLRVSGRSVLVETLEERGGGRGSAPGKKWRVAKSLVEVVKRAPVSARDPHEKAMQSVLRGWEEGERSRAPTRRRPPPFRGGDDPWPGDESVQVEIDRLRRENAALKKRPIPGNIVIFGRKHGEKTPAIVLTAAGRTALVETIAHRGHGRGSAPGKKWRVPYSLIHVVFRNMEEFLEATQD